MARKKPRQKQSVRKVSAKRASQNQHRMHKHADLGVPKPQVENFMALYKAKRLSEAEREAHAMTQRHPGSAFAWKALGTTLLEDGRANEALAHLQRSVELDDSDPLALTSLAAVYYLQGDHDKAVYYQSRAVELQPDYAPAQYRLAEMLQTAGKYLKALKHAKKAHDLGYDSFRCRVMVGSLLYQTKYFSEALELYKQLEKDYPNTAPVYNNLGNLYKDIGQYELAEAYYQKALDAQPGYVMAYSNIFFAKHYNPNASQKEIIEFSKGWDRHFALAEMPAPDSSRDVSKPLRVGMISSGFRIHPVGQMIATAMEHSRPDIHFYAYTTNDYDDYITQKIRESTRVWRPVRHLTQEALAQQIRDDAIDILIDLSGHGDGSCLQAISMRPAPLCIKWVGGLVNTMGLSSIDYLFSDSIETPEGVDDQYTEKLIRLPDDYICYMPCPYAPNTSSLPAIKNGYITLGCLNNPAKIGERLLAEWAKLMLELPESRLLLRGAQYESEDFCQWIRNTLGEQGIAEYRIILEGPAKHQEFLETYQRIDIALDSWPYSGGLTTCEAMLMGVPVVTLPGPTFAGRHSATHLINAGLQELVTSNWEEYRQRVLELANDLPNLAVIRAGLRTILHYSPVCDAPRFADHFNNALRAVWVRYCEGKEPEALTFNKEGELWFEDDKQPIELPEARSEETSDSESFEWQLDEPITIIDNAAVLPRHPDYPKWMASGHLAVISFDPASLLNKRVEELQEYGELHHYPHALLGDGQPATLYATLDAEKGSTLKPLQEEQQPEYLRDKLKVLAELPINTVALDQIEGLPSVDMLMLDDLHDAMKVLENGEQTLKNTLLIQVKVAFHPTHERQPNLAELQHWASRNGFRFYSLVNMRNVNQLASSSGSPGELLAADAVFVREEDALKKLGDVSDKKLGFLLALIFESEKTRGAVTAHEKENYAEGFSSIIARSGNAGFQSEKYNEIPKSFSRSFKEKMNPFGEDDRKHIEIVTENGLCSSCGACSGVCHIDDAIIYKEDVDGNIIPEIQDSCVNCGVCLAICPGIYYPEQPESELYDPVEGKVVNSGVGKSGSVEIFDNSQSGGLVTAVASYLLKSKKVTGVVVTIQDMQAATPYKAKTIIARSTDQLIAAQKSTYLPSPNLDKISHILKEAREDEKLAWVGLSCHMAALENMADFKKFKVGILDKIEYRLGLVCDRILSNASSEYLILRGGADRKKVDKLIYRDKSLPRGYPGDVNIVERGGKSKVLPYDIRMSVKNYFTPSRCHLCHDKMNLHSDVVFGDPHGLDNVDRRSGETVFLSRTDKGDQLMREVREYAYASWRHVSQKKVFEGQFVDKIKKDWESIKAAWVQLEGKEPQYMSSVDYSTKYPKKKELVSQQKELLSTSLSARNFKNKTEYARYILQRGAVPGVDPLYVRNKPLVAQVIGANYTNKGAMMMLLSIAQKLQERGVVVSLPPGEFTKNSLIYNLVPSIKGLVDTDDIDFVFDASGFLYTDQWYPLPMRLNIDKRFQYFKDKGAKIFLLPQAFGPFENSDLRHVMGKALSCATLVYPRDPDSKQYLESARERCDNKSYKVMPDFTNLLKPKAGKDDARFNVFACVIPNLRMLDRNKSDDERAAYFAFMYSAIRSIIDSGCKPFFLIHEGNGDIALADRINEMFGYAIEVVVEPDPCRLKAIIGSSRMLLSSRFHGLVSGLCQSVPSFSVGWSHKYFHLFNDYDFPEGCMPLNSSDKEIHHMVQRLLFTDREKIVNKISAQAERQKRDVEKMWDEIFEMMGVNASNGK
ncbi:MAG: tetratricopeptide repeat protein [Pseudomonadota bacterium]